MHTKPFVRRFVLTFAASLVAAATACSTGQPQPSGMPGTGGDVSTVTPSPLCGPASTGAGADTGKGVPQTVPPGIPGFALFPPQFGTTAVNAAVAPPAISGGTLRILADGHTAVAADPDRDKVYIVDLTALALTATIALDPGDEPGRLVVDAANRAHVVLRRGGALASIDVTTGELLQRRDVCAAPRGVAYDTATDLLHVACAGGELISLPAAGGAAVRTLTLAGDLRDVVVEGQRLRVSRFRTAELLTVEPDGTVSNRFTPPDFRRVNARAGQLFTASGAFRMAEMPDGSGVMMLHQRGVAETDEVSPVVGGYGGPDGCSGIVHPTVTMVSPDGSVRTGPALAGLVLAVDMAITTDGQRIAFVSAGNATNTSFLGPPGTSGVPRVFVSDVGSVTDGDAGCMPDGKHAPCNMSVGGPVMTADGQIVSCQSQDPSVPQEVGQPIAVAFDGGGKVVVQSREPARLYLQGGAYVPLSADSRNDTGHLIFHANAGGFLACASCHLEGNDDGRTWNFTCEGKRRTQSLHAGGLRGTEPFHWDGHETDMNRLMTDVFVGRMSGPTLPGNQIDALMTWVDNQPRVPRAAPADAAAVERGRVLFNDSSRGASCASCHSGARFTNNQTVDVGTGGPLQVPSLVGIGSRGPFMHNGCAKTLAGRFDAACGGDRHGATADLTGGQIADLVTYMQSI